MKGLKVTLETVTPLILGGANPSLEAEFRLPSLKGVLRFWYRAIDPEFRKWEDKLFGSANTGSGQSRFLMRLEQAKRIRQGRIDHKNEPRYFTFPFRGKDRWKGRPYIEINQAFTIYLIRRPVKSEDQQEDWKRLLSSLWIFSAIGGLGSRSRRGFGSVRIQDWQPEDLPEAQSLMQSLPLLSRAQTVDEWKEMFNKGLAQIQSWLFTWKGEPTHTIVSSQMRCFIANSIGSWDDAMKSGADLLKEFRRKLKPKKERALFGLPLQGVSMRDRMASPVWFRVVNIGENYYPFFALLEAPIHEIMKSAKGQKAQKHFARAASIIKEVNLSQIYGKFAEYLKQEGFTEVTE